jgi:uncharacterized protein (TIGR02145 family)
MKRSACISGVACGLALCCGLLLGGNTRNNSPNVYTDPRDGEEYGTVVIGRTVWMTRNLNYASPKSECYEHEPAHCERLGRLYVLPEARTACPPGWHLPTPGDVEELHRLMGSRLNRLAAAGEWRVKKAEKIRNQSGLGILPAGRYDRFVRYSKETKTWTDTVTFHQLGVAASYWLDDTETERGLIHWHLGEPIGPNKSAMHRHHIDHDVHRFSVRCVCAASGK